MKALKKIYIALIMLFLYAPMLVMVVFSFNASNSTSVMSGFSLKWYVEMFRNATALTALRNTLVLAVTSALISIIIGTAAAVGINAMKKRWLRSAVMTVTNVKFISFFMDSSEKFFTARVPNSIKSAAKNNATPDKKAEPL